MLSHAGPLPLLKLKRQSCLCREGVRRVRMHIPLPHGPQQSVQLITATQERVSSNWQVVTQILWEMIICMCKLFSCQYIPT